MLTGLYSSRFHSNWTNLNYWFKDQNSWLKKKFYILIYQNIYGKRSLPAKDSSL